MKIAYIILGHKSPDQIKRLVCKLNTEGVSFLIHFDKKSENKLYKKLVDEVSIFPNVYFIKRYKIYWGDFSIVRATIEAIKEIFIKNISFDWVILLSGQDYPLKSNNQIQETLQTNEDRLFISHCVYPAKESKVMNNTYRIDYYHINIFNIRLVFPGDLAFNTANESRIKRFIWLRWFSLVWLYLVKLFPIKRKFPEGFIPYVGSQFWCLSKDCITYIYNFILQNPGFVKFFNYVDIPDEMFFQTIILNSMFRDRVASENLFYIDWKNPNPKYPRTFVKNDFEILVNCQKLFARKFDATRDVDILDMLDRHTLNKVGID
ncbi:MAG: beta-1,6-N-acetylglucosaminyltransferase [Nostoc sp. DedQUE12a]|nr:beta-1,6-N-acetylglucosaminyltransferase [Nostoc sp. DedQUE12a]